MLSEETLSKTKTVIYTCQPCRKSHVSCYTTVLPCKNCLRQKRGLECIEQSKAYEAEFKNRRKPSSSNRRGYRKSAWAHIKQHGKSKRGSPVIQESKSVAVSEPPLNQNDISTPPTLPWPHGYPMDYVCYNQVHETWQPLIEHFAEQREEIQSADDIWLFYTSVSINNKRSAYSAAHACPTLKSTLLRICASDILETLTIN